MLRKKGLLVKCACEKPSSSEGESWENRKITFARKIVLCKRVSVERDLCRFELLKEKSQLGPSNILGYGVGPNGLNQNNGRQGFLAPPCVYEFRQ